jgi:acyl-CoA reductase-like NAD-dependent aldehyde dehydrogenase
MIQYVYWRRASGSAELDVIDSFTQQPLARYRQSSTDDVNAACSKAEPYIPHVEGAISA